MLQALTYIISNRILMIRLFLYVFYLRDFFTFLEIWIDVRLVIHEYIIDVCCFLLPVISILLLLSCFLGLIFFQWFTEEMLGYQFIVIFVAYTIRWIYLRLFEILFELESLTIIIN